MCGISGEARFGGGAADLAAVDRMTSALRSRGPDGSGRWTDGWVALGHRRLSIIDLSASGAQPMAVPEPGAVISFNGCVYNYRELRAELQAAGYRFRSTSDTEVALAAYHRWGERFAEHLVGMFAIAIVDRARRRLVLARDRLGIKPLYLATRRAGCGSRPPCPRRSAPGTSTPASTRWRYTITCPGTPSSRRRGRGCAGSASSRRPRYGSSSPTAAPGTTSTGARSTCAGPSTPGWTTATGARRSVPRCGPRSTAAWSRTCRSACCCPAAWTPA